MADRAGGSARRLRPADTRSSPPLQLLTAPSSAPLTSFIGRQEELSRAASLLSRYRLVTFTGVGGVGKTRLATALAEARISDFPDGSWFVDLGSLRSEEFVLAQLAAAVGVEEPEHGYSLVEATARHLAPRQALIVLDNCEHVAAEAAVVVTGLLEAAPCLRVLATSREPLGVDGEVTWVVPPLSKADSNCLFVERARRASPDAEFDSSDEILIEEICSRLDRLPLAIELAAARVRVLAGSQIAAALSEGDFALLGRRGGTGAARHGSLKASIEWSYRLLSVEEQRLLGELSVFAGGFDPEAVLAVCPSGSVRTLVSLVDRSLVALAGQDEIGPRYRLLETIRSYAAETLEGPEAVELKRRQRDYFLALAEAAEPHLGGRDQKHWLARLAIEQDNLRLALTWSRDSGDHEGLARLAVALTPYWAERSQWSDWGAWLDAALASTDDLAPVWHSRLLNRCCYKDIWLGNWLAVPAIANRALELARGAGDEREAAMAKGALGVVFSLAIGPEAARPYIEEALAAARSLGDSWTQALAITYFSLSRLFQSDPDEPRHLLEEAMAVAEAAGDHRSLLLAQWVAAAAAATQGRLGDAQALIHQLLPAARGAGNAAALIGGLLVQGWVHLIRGQLDRAGEAAKESVAVARASEESDVLEGLAVAVAGWVQLAAGDFESAQASFDRSAALTRGLRPSSVQSDAGRPGGAIPRMAALPLVFRASVEAQLGEVQVARATLEEATEIATAAGFTWILGRASLIRAVLLVGDEDHEKAEAAVHQAIALQRDASDVVGLVDSVEFLAGLIAEPAPEEALRLWGAAHRRRLELGYERFPSEQDSYERAVAGARQAAGAGADQAWSEGAALSFDEALAYASRGRGRRGRPSRGWSSLTPTELEVVRLVGQHLTNKAISDRMFISLSTVKSHLAHIFTKLGITSRSQLAAQAIQRGVA